MQLHCLQIQATFGPEGVSLASPGAAQILLDEHGGTFVLKAGDLQVAEMTGQGTESAILMEIALREPERLAGEIEEFAARHSLPLETGRPPAPELWEEPILAACHIPQKHLFVFSEKSELKARATQTSSIKLTVTGAFRSRRLESQEADLVIHLKTGAMARLLHYFLTLARKRI